MNADLIPEWPIRKLNEYYLLFHSARCRFHQAHPISIIQSRDLLMAKLLACDDDECFVSVGTVKSRNGAAHVKRKEVHGRYVAERGPRHGITDPKTTAQLATWMAQQKKRPR